SELQLSDRGRITGAQVLTWGLDKSHLVRLHHKERTLHVFCQFLAGATLVKHDRFNLEDPCESALPALSGPYCSPMARYPTTPSRWTSSSSTGTTRAQLYRQILRQSLTRLPDTEMTDNQSEFLSNLPVDEQMDVRKAKRLSQAADKAQTSRSWHVADDLVNAMAKLHSNVLELKLGELEAARSTTASSARYPAHWVDHTHGTCSTRRLFQRRPAPTGTLNRRDPTPSPSSDEDPEYVENSPDNLGLTSRHSPRRD
ncbi:hypothetical protein AURDEDRAFT_163524, partial [Auricularia subglabra TFB-10046 SS5]